MWRLFKMQPQTLGTTNSSWHRLSDGQHLPFPNMLGKTWARVLVAKTPFDTFFWLGTEWDLPSAVSELPRPGKDRMPILFLWCSHLNH